MAPRLAKSQIDLITSMNSSELFTGLEIAAAANCSTRAIRRLRSNIRYYGTYRAPGDSGGRTRSITPIMSDALCEHLLVAYLIPTFQAFHSFKSDSTDYSKILTSVAVNCVRCNRQMAKPILDIEQERRRNFEKHELERITDDRQQMNMTLSARLASEINLQQYTERLRKNTENTIASLDIRNLAEKELLVTISEPTELTSELKEDSDYANVIKNIEKAIANDTRTQQRSLWRKPTFGL